MGKTDNARGHYHIDESTYNVYFEISDHAMLVAHLGITSVTTYYDEEAAAVAIAAAAIAAAAIDVLRLFWGNPLPSASNNQSLKQRNH